MPGQRPRRPCLSHGRRYEGQKLQRRDGNHVSTARGSCQTPARRVLQVGHKSSEPKFPIRSILCVGSAYPEIHLAAIIHSGRRAMFTQRQHEAHRPSGSSICPGVADAKTISHFSNRTASTKPLIRQYLTPAPGSNGWDGGREQHILAADGRRYTPIHISWSWLRGRGFVVPTVGRRSGNALGELGRWASIFFRPENLF
jgi:hypothetical protein